MQVLYEYFKSKIGLGRLITTGKGIFAKLRGRSSDKPAILQNFIDAKKEINYDVNYYTPWACTLPWRGHGVEESPIHLPDHPSCKKNCKKHFSSAGGLQRAVFSCFLSQKLRLSQRACRAPPKLFRGATTLVSCVFSPSWIVVKVS